MRVLVVVSILSLIAMSGLALAREPSSPPIAQFHEANRLFADSEYRQAADAYERLIESGAQDAALYYNAGCAWSALGEWGRAAARFERALRMSPRFEKARQNLDLARTGKADLPFHLVPIEKLMRLASSTEYFYSTIFVWWLSGLSAAGWIWLNPGRTRRWMAAISALAFVAALAAGGLFVGRWMRESAQAGYVTADQVVSRSGPSEEHQEVDLLSEGVRVIIDREPRNGWVRIHMPGGRSSFVPADSVARV